MTTDTFHLLLLYTYQSFLFCVPFFIYTCAPYLVTICVCFVKCMYDDFFLSVRLLSVLRGRSVFSSPPQRPMTSDFEGFLYPRFYPLHLFSYLNSWERASISLLMFSAKQGHYWYHFYDVFGMTRSLTADWTRDLPHSKPALSRKRYVRWWTLMFKSQTKIFYLYWHCTLLNVWPNCRVA